MCFGYIFWFSTTGSDPSSFGFDSHAALYPMWVMFFKTTKATKCYFRFSYSLSLDYPRYFFLSRDCLELKEDKNPLTKHASTRFF